MNKKKIGCLFVNINDDFCPNNYLKDNETFFIPNAINSFKKWNPDVDVHYIHNDNLQEYCKLLQIEDMFNHISLIRLSLVINLMKHFNYDKLIFLGIDTITCSRLDELLDDDSYDAIYTLGAPQIVETEYWKSPIYSFNENGITYHDVAFINGDIACYNNIETAQLVFDLTLKNWHEHVDQGTMNYLFINQEKYNKKVKIVDFPYYKSNVVYNVRSKGVVGGYCLVRGNVLNGRNGQIISDRYPMLDFYLNDNKLFTSDHKQVKVFHICEGLANRSENDEMSYEESVNEIKTMWFNKETIDFLEKECGCNFK
jgi:hypothetical protein